MHQPLFFNEKKNFSFFKKKEKNISQKKNNFVLKNFRSQEKYIPKKKIFFVVINRKG